MQNLNYPVNFVFNIGTLANDFTATDASGREVAYVRQKMFKLKEDILIYSDQSRSRVDYRIKADRWIDFSAAYSMFDDHGYEFGKIVREGWASIWKASYEIIDQHEQSQYRINEENPWVKVVDSILGEIPVIGFLTGYLFNPAYLLTNNRGEVLIKLKKIPSLFGRRFEIEQLGPIQSDDEPRIILGLMMMLLLERRRG